VSQLPNKDAPDVAKKLHRKIADRERAAKKKARRLAAMTPEERAAHQAWHAAHRPGSRAGRADRRIRRKHSAELRALTEREPPHDPVIEKLDRARDVIRARLAALQRECDQEPEVDIFS
jgi:CRP-like cAMP-binding protein